MATGKPLYVVSIDCGYRQATVCSELRMWLQAICSEHRMWLPRLAATACCRFLMAGLTGGLMATVSHRMPAVAMHLYTIK